MEVLPFVTFVLWSTGLSTAALVVAAVVDWRLERRSHPLLPSRPATPPLQQKLNVPAVAEKPVLLKAA